MLRVGLLLPSGALRRGFEAALDEFPGITVVSTDFHSLNDPAFDEVDVIILSGKKIVEEGFLEEFLRVNDPPAVLFLSDSSSMTRTWIELGLRSSGVISADSGEERLAAAVYALAQGLSVWDSDQLPEFGFVNPVPKESSTAGLEGMVEQLTDRELQVFQLVAQGLSNKQLAQHLSISEHTVKFHISSIYSKLSAGSRTEAVRIGYQHGLISL